MRNNRLLLKVKFAFFDRIQYLLLSARAHFRKASGVMTNHKDTDGERELIVVSVTSIPSRLSKLHVVVESIMEQTMKPDRIILYLGLNLENVRLPKKLERMKTRGLEIRYREDKDLKPHTKYFYAMQEFKNCVIITMDDDIIYNKNIIENLKRAHKKYPRAVCAIRAHKMMFKDDEILNYNKWEWEVEGGGMMKPRMDLFATGVGGVLYPRNSLPKETFDRQKIKDMCLNADDVWLKFMEVKNNTAVVKAICGNYHLNMIKPDQKKALQSRNVGMNRNDVYIKKMMDYTGLKVKDFMA